MLHRAWKPISASVLVAGSTTYFAYRTFNAEDSYNLPVRIKDPNGKSGMSMRSIALLSLDTVQKRIREHATEKTYIDFNGSLWHHATAALASNDPIEDANASQIIVLDANDPSAPGEFLFLTVMDGHGGHYTSQLLSRVLVKAVALELNGLISKPNTETRFSLFDRMKSVLGPTPSPIHDTAPDPDPQRVSLAIQDAFVKLDAEIINAPLHVLANSLDEESKKNKVVPDLSKHPLALTTMLPAVSGSCALMALFDIAHRDLYVASTGDSRAVAGVWELAADGTGRWRVDVLSEDQTARNPSEIKRIISEHPKDESGTVIVKGRILGSLEPSRAFGDALYKWPRVVQETLYHTFMAGNNLPLRSPHSTFFTPPYVTARPVVTHRKISFTEAGEAPSPKKGTRFLVLATDGLWDALSNDEVVCLVAGHLTGLKGNISKSEIHKLVPTFTSSQGFQGKIESNKSVEGEWSFTESNIGAHLLHNAFGGANEIGLRRLLSIPAPYARQYRDDTTVSVVWWEDGNEQNACISTQKFKARL